MMWTCPLVPNKHIKWFRTQLPNVAFTYSHNVTLHGYRTHTATFEIHVLLLTVTSMQKIDSTMHES